MTKEMRELLERRKWELENSFTGNSFVDGLVRQEIERIDKRLIGS